MDSQGKIKKDIDITELLSFLYVERGKDFFYDTHCHSFWEMVYVDGGQVSIVAENAEHQVNQGELIFHKPGEYHATVPNEKNHHNMLMVSFFTQSGAMRFFENKILSVNAHQKRIIALMFSEAEELFDKITGMNDGNFIDLHSPKFGGRQLMASYLEQLLISLIRYNQDGPPSEAGNARAEKKTAGNLASAIEAYLSQNIYERVSILDISRKFNVSQSYINRVFKGVMGKSVIKYYLELKMTEAKKLIRASELNMTQIAELLGYAGIHHFSRIFKKTTGVSPSEYEKAAKL